MDTGRKTCLLVRQTLRGCRHGPEGRRPGGALKDPADKPKGERAGAKGTSNRARLPDFVALPRLRPPPAIDSLLVAAHRFSRRRHHRFRAPMLNFTDVTIRRGT